MDVIIYNNSLLMHPLSNPHYRVFLRAIISYKKEPGVITFGFEVMGFPVTGSKKMGMPNSNNYEYQPTNEFSIKPNQLVKIVHYWVDAHVNYPLQE